MPWACRHLDGGPNPAHALQAYLNIGRTADLIGD
jgi:hypothetical protein